MQAIPAASRHLDAEKAMPAVALPGSVDDIDAPSGLKSALRQQMTVAVQNENASSAAIRSHHRSPRLKENENFSIIRVSY